MTQHIRVAVAWAALMTLAPPLVAGSLDLEVAPMDDPELAALRGGFMLGNLEIAIGLEQVVGIDGESLVINRLNIPNLNQVVGDRGLQHELETVLQVVAPGGNGSTSVISGGFGSGGGWLTQIQNSLDSTVIQNYQQLNIELNNLGSSQPLPFQLSDQLLPLLGR